MTKNHQVISLFLSDFYRNKREELLEIISPNFAYHTPFCGELNFTEFLDYMSRIASQAQAVKLTEPSSKDDVLFHHTFNLKILDFGEDFDEDIIGQTSITMKNGLIEYIEIGYEDEFLNTEKFLKIKAKLIG